MRKLYRMIALFCLTAAMTVPASAMTFSIDAPGDPAYGKSTSIEVVYTADNGVRKNEDISKNAALAPPSFGSPGIDTLNTGKPLTPNLAPGYMLGTGAIINGSTGSAVALPGTSGLVSGDAASGPVYVPDASTITVTTTPNIDVTVPAISTGYTGVTDDLYYSNGSLGTLKIPAIGLTVKVVQGTDTAALAKGAGHFTDTSIWDGNCCFAAHNRGTNSYFGKIHTLNVGDTITLTTKFGTRTYSVFSVNKISETDNSLLTPTTDNCITLFTCVRDQKDYRWAVRAVEIV